MIPGHGFTFIGSLMLLINYYKPQILKRRKQCGTRPYHNGYFTLCRPFPLIIPFPGRQPGIDNRNLIAEPLIKAHHGLIGQCNLRYQKDNLLSPFQYIFHQLHIYFRFSAAGNSVKKIGVPVTFFIIPDEPVRRRFLFFIQDSGMAGMGKLFKRRSVNFSGQDFNLAFVYQRF